ncbi:MAG: YfjI family protein, partial [Planctomycetota bacterium]
PTAIVISGHGVHLYWFFKEPWIIETDAERERAAALAWRWHGTVCMRAKERGWTLENLGDLARVLRLPGTQNHWNGTVEEVRVHSVDFDRRYNPDDFEPYLADDVLGPTETEAQVGDLTLHADAEPPAAKLLALAGESPKFWHTWNRQRTDLADTSQSGYDLSLATIAALAGWTDQQIADLIIAARRNHDEKPEKALRADYMARTIAKARQTADERRAEPAGVDLSRFLLEPEGANTTTDVPSPDDWPDPRPIVEDLPPVMPFDAGLLPGALRPWIMDIAERMQCPPDFPAVGAMIALASLIGRKLAIRPKRYDDWTVVPNLWGALIGPPAVMKSPPLNAVLKPLNRLVVDAQKAYEEEAARHERANSVHRLRQSVLETEVKKAMRADEGADELIKQMEELAPPEPPSRRRYVVNDTTVEKLQILLNENRNGLLIHRDELVGFLKYLERDGQESARAFFLETWEGSGRHEVDRVGRGTVVVEAACLSIVGTIQPGPFGQYLRAATDGGAGDDGLVQRFQLAVWPDVPERWENVDRWPDRVSKSAVWDLFQHLDEFDASMVNAELDEFEPDGIPFVHFHPDAQDQFDDWMFERENRLRAGDEPPAIEAHLTKYRSLIPSLALVIHLVEGQGTKVAAAALDKAIRWGRYLESHALRIYAPALESGPASARALAERLLTDDVEDGFTAREVYRNCWSGLSGPEETKSAIARLVALGWLKRANRPTGGKMKTIYRVNPKVYGRAAAELARG